MGCPSALEGKAEDQQRQEEGAEQILSQHAAAKLCATIGRWEQNGQSERGHERLGGQDQMSQQ